MLKLNEVSEQKVQKNILVDAIDKSILPALTISADFTRYAFIRKKKVGFLKSKKCVVTNGEESELYDDILPFLIFNPHSNILAYSARTGKNDILYVGDTKIETDGSVGSFQWSPDGKHFACCVENNDGWYVEIDGKRNQLYSSGDYRFVFSPDSKNLAYRAKKGKRQAVVLNGEEIALHDGIGENSLTFSPDGYRFAYAAREGPKWFWVVDGKEDPKYDGFASSISFSPDSKHYAYTAMIRDDGIIKGFVNFNGVEGFHYDGIGRLDPVFSLDSSYIAYVAVSPPFSNNRKDGRSHSEHCKKAFLVINEKEGPFEFGIDHVLFDSANENIIYACYSYGGWYVGSFNIYDPKISVSTHYEDNCKEINFLNITPDDKRIIQGAKYEAGFKSLNVLHGIYSREDQESIKCFAYDKGYLRGDEWYDFLKVNDNYIHFLQSDEFSYISYSKRDKAVYFVTTKLL
jgi:Tol biopolymer transport system component